MPYFSPSRGHEPVGIVTAATAQFFADRLRHALVVAASEGGDIFATVREAIEELHADSPFDHDFRSTLLDLLDRGLAEGSIYFEIPDEEDEP